MPSPCPPLHVRRHRQVVKQTTRRELIAADIFVFESIGRAWRRWRNNVVLSAVINSPKLFG
jgi:hypothetical protein